MGSETRRSAEKVRLLKQSMEDRYLAWGEAKAEADMRLVVLHQTHVSLNAKVDEARAARNDGSPCPIQGPHDCDRSEHESR